MIEPAKDLSFSKEDRLFKPEEFARVRKVGKRLVTRGFTLYILANGLGRTRPAQGSAFRHLRRWMAAQTGPA